MDRKRKRGLTITGYLLPALILISLVIYIPIFLNLFYSFFRWSSFSPVRKFVGLDNYSRLITDKTIGTALLNNIKYAVISVIFQIGVSLLIAVGLEEKRMRKCEPFFRTVYFFPSIISLTVVGLLWQIIMSPVFGIINPLLEMVHAPFAEIDLLGNTHTAIYSVIAVSQWQYIGFTLVLFLVAIQQVPDELYEAAELDGAGFFRRMFYITIPYIKGIIIVNLVVTVIGSFKVFEEVYTMTAGGPGRSSEVLGTYLYRAGFRNDEMGYASAIGSLIFIITFILSMIQLKLSNLDDQE